MTLYLPHRSDTLAMRDPATFIAYKIKTKVGEKSLKRLSLHYDTYRKIVAIVGTRIVSLTFRRRGQRLVWISIISEPSCPIPLQDSLYSLYLSAPPVND